MLSDALCVLSHIARPLPTVLNNQQLDTQRAYVIGSEGCRLSATKFQLLHTRSKSDQVSWVGSPALPPPTMCDPALPPAWCHMVVHALCMQLVPAGTDPSLVPAVGSRWLKIKKLPVFLCHGQPQGVLLDTTKITQVCGGERNSDPVPS